MSDLLIEILTEELPARFVDDAREQLVARVTEHLGEACIGHGTIRGMSTPRRLVVLAEDVAESTELRTIDVKGPPSTASYDAERNPTAAMLGFCRGQGVDPAMAFEQDAGGRKYIYVRKTLPARASSELIEAFLSRLPREIVFPKAMRWEASGFQFARPIRGLLGLFGTAVLNWEIAGVHGSSTTCGLRIGKPKTITISSPEEYVRRLREAFVIVDPSERRYLIEKQMDRLLNPLGFRLGPNAGDLMDEVVNLVEYPTCFVGNLPTIASELPESVVRSVLQEQMHSFILYENDGNVVPHFLGVRNGLSDFIDIVRHGNENVANARLQDAAFFIAEDMRQPLRTYAERLDTLVFMDRLGTMADKTRRLADLASLATAFFALTRLEQDTLFSAAELAKADLATNMVKEYTSLQGEIGGVYLMREGQAADVVSAVREQYMPRSPSENVAPTRAGRLLGILDKVDLLVGILGTGFNPSGSEDPYGLRRAGNGIIRTIMEGRERVDIESLVSAAIGCYETTVPLATSEGLKERVIDYLRGRVLQYFKERQMMREYAPFEHLSLAELYSVPTRMQTLGTFSGDPLLTPLADSHRRIQNITRELPSIQSLPSDLLLTEPEEVALRQVTETTAPIVELSIKNGDYAHAIAACKELAGPITSFFDHILVMATDDRVRSARLLLLCFVKHILGSVCDFSKLT